MSDFVDQVKNLAKRVKKLKDSILTEEATKTSVIMPFSKLLDMMFLILKNSFRNSLLM
ncbi:hypothetical protein PACILC2_51370 [Paenibacillus cisolokensis]|uniref:Uncharacterized protein n=1 Tax=Paenibacillus cisolokensis TaxID=1658519 RepID=A0ABQ4NEC6_9BACL|nr:hypothetical protein PACILC2_51370 [Paenibacillus cisolokensis]